MKPSPPTLKNPTEVTVDASWEAVPGATGYILLEVLYPASFDEATRHEFDGNTTSATISNLIPTSTYQFKVVAVTAEGESTPSDAANIDTAVGNCTPTPSCTIS